MMLVDQLRDRFGVEPVLRVVGVAPSTYYGWVKRAAAPCARRREDAGLLTQIRQIHDGHLRQPSRARHARRQGVRIGRKRVERLMRADGRQGAYLRRRWRIPSTRPNPRATPAPDLVNRRFTATAPNPLWVADATRIPCAEGTLWLAAVTGEAVEPSSSLVAAGVGRRLPGPGFPRIDSDA